ncbi:uncharacterized protein V6R79_010458, partial [Siganus canaliculatus]
MHHSFGRRREDHVWDSISPPSRVGPLLTPWLLSTGRRLPGGAWSSHRPSRAVGAGRGPYPRPPLHPPQLALDPPTREIAKQYFKIIQALHHKNIIDTAVEKQEPPRGMLRQILKLTSFIKPSSPSDSVRQAVQDNTTNWTLNNLRILQTHYSTLLSDFNPPPHNPLAFQVASKWAQKRFLGGGSRWGAKSVAPLLFDKEQFPPLPKPQRLPGRKYTLYLGPREPLQAQAAATRRRMEEAGARGEDVEPGGVPCPSPPSSQSTPIAARLLSGMVGAPPPALSPIINISRNKPAITTTTRTPVLPTPPLPSRPPSSSAAAPLPPPRPPPPLLGAACRPKTKTTTHQVSPSPSPSPPPSSPRKRIKLTHAPAITHSSDEEDFVQPPPNSRRPPGNIRLQSNKDNISRQPPYTELVSRSFHPNSSTFSNVAVLDDDSIHQFNLTDFPFTPPGPTVGGAVAGRWGDHHGPAARPQGGATGKVMTTQATLKQTHAANKATSDPKPSAPPAAVARGPGVLPIGRDAPPADPVEQNDRQTPHVNFNPDPTDNIIFPYYHKARPNRKLIEWKIHTHQDICIIGDSNLHRIPPFSATNLQIDSYPGAAFYHFWQILKTTPPQVQVKLLVLSVGLNNRDQDPEKTSIKQLRMLFRGARTAFPNAT